MKNCIKYKDYLRQHHVCNQRFPQFFFYILFSCNNANTKSISNTAHINYLYQYRQIDLELEWDVYLSSTATQAPIVTINHLDMDLVINTTDRQQHFTFSNLPKNQGCPDPPQLCDSLTNNFTFNRCKKHC